MEVLNKSQFWPRCLMESKPIAKLIPPSPPNRETWMPVDKIHRSLFNICRIIVCLKTEVWSVMVGTRWKDREVNTNLLVSSTWDRECPYKTIIQRLEVFHCGTKRWTEPQCHKNIPTCVWKVVFHIILNIITNLCCISNLCSPVDRASEFGVSVVIALSRGGDLFFLRKPKMNHSSRSIKVEPLKWNTENIQYLQRWTSELLTSLARDFFYPLWMIDKVAAAPHAWKRPFLNRRGTSFLFCSHAAVRRLMAV